MNYMVERLTVLRVTPRPRTNAILHLQEKPDLEQGVDCRMPAGHDAQSRRVGRRGIRFTGRLAR